MRPKRIVVLLPSALDRRHFSTERYNGQYRFDFRGRQLWHFPGGFFRILRFHPLAYIERLVRELSRERVDGVLSTDEYVGSLIAAAVSKRLGLPTADPAIIAESQHKYYARLSQRRVVPEAVPDFQLMTVPPAAPEQIRLPFPFFVKPVRGSFSIFADRVDSYGALRRHLGLNALWRFGLKRVLRPCNELLRHFTGCSIDVNRFIGETYMSGDQVCIDGFVHDGEVHVMGVIDALMFPGTNAFERFQYPSQLPAEVQLRMRELTKRVVHGLGMQHGQFNLELIYDRASDRLRIIELHPRLSYQFADMYSDVDGINTYDVMLRLALGDKPELAQAAGRHKLAASLVIRKFAGRRVTAVPDRETVAAFRERHPGARLEIDARKGSMNPEMRAMGSYRCALINVGADSPDELALIRADADATLRFEVDYGVP